jgi:hypothetical protein
VILIRYFFSCVFFLSVVLFCFVAAWKENCFRCGGREEARKNWTREGEGRWCSWSYTLVCHSLDFSFKGWDFKNILMFL